MNDKVTLSYGLRYSMFQNVGKGKEFIYGEGEEIDDKNIVDTLRYDGIDFRKSMCREIKISPAL